MKPHYVSFKTKIGVAAVVLLLEAAILGSFWVVGALSGSTWPPPLWSPRASVLCTERRAYSRTIWMCYNRLVKLAATVLQILWHLCPKAGVFFDPF